MSAGASAGGGDWLPVRLQDVEDGVAVVVFDHPDSKVNVIDSAVLAALGAVLTALERSPPPVGVLFLSGKDHFSAGADIDLIHSIRSREEALLGSQAGQEAFARLAALPRPTVAAISGTCLGGGLEWALACDRILVSSAPETRLGLPEVKLGLLPGWGGTQRLPRRIGLVAAVDMIASGRTLDAETGRARGLVDRIVPRDRLRAEGIAELKAIGGRPPRRPARRRVGVVDIAARWLPPLRLVLFSRLSREVGRRAGPHYPAPPAIVEAVRAGFFLRPGSGTLRERELFADLAVGSVSRRLVDLFLLGREAKSWYGAEESSAAVPAVGRLAVLGAGVMGAGIAHLAASRGLTVVIRDVSEAALASGMERIRRLVDADIARRRLSEAEGSALTARITPVMDLARVAGAEMIIEAVVEDLALKKQVLGEAAAVADGALFATNTSALPVGEMAGALPDPSRCVGIHFFHPVHRMPLVEIVAPAGAAPGTLGSAILLARRLGKTPVKVADAPGFLVNRLLAVYLGEATTLLEEGYSIAGVDGILRGFGMPMGPFQLLDEVGLDVSARVAGHLAAAFGERLARTDLLEKMLSAGRQGKKSGLGFYRHGEGMPTADEAGVGSLLDHRRATVAAAEDELVPRLLYSMVAEAVRCLEEHVVSRPGEVDLALVLGIGWPPFRGGLLCWADEIGAPALVAGLDRLADAHGSRFVPSPALRRRALENSRFLDA